MSFVEQLKGLMKARRARVTDLAPVLGMARQNLSAALSGRHDVRASTLEGVAAALDSEWVLVPREHLLAVQQILAGKGSGPDQSAKSAAELFMEGQP